MVFVLLEGKRADRLTVRVRRMVLEEPVDRLCLPPRRLRHALCGAPRRGGEEDRFLLPVKAADDRIDRCGLSGAGASGEEHHAPCCRPPDRLLLQVVEPDLLLLFHLPDALLDGLLLHAAFASCVQVQKDPCHCPFRLPDAH